MKIGLALGGGGFKGAAHTGILEQLEKFRIKPEMVSGVSAGAIVGLLFCEGGSGLVEKFFYELDSRGIVSRKNIFKQKNPDKILSQIGDLLKEMVKTKDIKDLKTKFIAAATDLITGELVVFDSGDPISAVLASSSYPGVFSCSNREGMILADGGILNNLPADLLKNRGAEFVIGSRLNSLSKLDTEKITRTTTLSRSIEIMTNDSDRHQIEICDYVFSPPLNNFKWYSFEHSADMTHIGRVYAGEHIDDLMAEIYKKTPKNLVEKILGK